MEGIGRRAGPPAASPDPGTVSECPAKLTFSPPPPPPLPDFLLSSLLCPRVISLMMCNALKVFHQPDLLKWSMGNALGRFSSHPRSLSLLLRLCLSLSLIFLVKSFLLSVLCSKASFFPSAFLCCLLHLSPQSLCVSLNFCFCLSPPFSLSLWRLN